MSAAVRRFGFVTKTFRPDLDDDAPPTTYGLRCLTLTEDDTECGAESSRSEDATDPQTWVFEHVRDNPAHTSFAEIIERPWIVVPGERT
ncbi:hypothetical protein ABZS76_03995 [Streptomyces sp. NPDC005562]|uniref:DUF7848 domain-containing protein n=1 Tax=unclassified Streptomyces TaxID=2593676 RepID=UPI0033B83890